MLIMLSASDSKDQWPGLEAFLRSVTLVVGKRNEHNYQDANQLLSKIQPSGILLETNWPEVSSRDIRRSLMQGKEHVWLLSSLKKYINSNWLYASVDANNSL